MENRNAEPLKILAVAGFLLLILAGGYRYFFPGKQMAAAPVPGALSPAAKSAVPAPERVDTLKAAVAGGCTAKGNYAGMDGFYHAVRQAESGRDTVHIAYFGDSMIEGDLVTQTLRRLLQKRFGGSGVGFIPLTTPLPGFRTTIRQSFNDDWTICSFVHPDKCAGACPGLSGYVYISQKGADAKFESPPGSGPFRRAELLFGGTKPITLEARFDSLAVPVTLAPAGAVSSYTLRRDTAFSSLEITVTSEEPGILYGVNFENGPGTYVDNYAFRGNSGLPLAAISAGILTGFNSLLGNRLLILHYGLNVYVPGVEDYHWYELAMESVIRHLKESSPGISILVVSMTDRATLISGEYLTPAGLPGFIGLQQRVAEKEQVAFFNLYEAMGGAGSMKKWVEGTPKLAADDYTHPNGAGASKIATLLFDFLMTGYEKSLPGPDSASSANSPAP